MGIEKIIVEMDIKVGDSVKVINGPFEGFMGSVSSYDEEKQTMRVLISMFGRDTLVELEYAQIDKL
jgi:transcriptional antiterminator NusG